MKASKTQIVVLGGRQWKIRTAMKPLPDCWGYADFAKKEIVVCPTAEKRNVYREVVIHEAIHALFPILDESVVKAAAIEIDDALEILGL